ncbi:MAG: glycosyltransferase family 2 protein [Nitrospira sp.]|nr:glycosyltransferase family 2 protein [Nitrospira sp.]
MSRPKVSVCIPAYNYARFMPEAIDSVLKQTFTDYEILIIDDCSHDNTKEVVSEYAKKDKRIRFKINLINIGMVNNWNACLAEAKGTYIKFLFCDDFLSSISALEEMVTILDGNPSISLVASSRNIVDGTSRTIKTLGHFRGTTVLSGEKVIVGCISRRKNLIGEPTVVMFRKKNAERGFLPYYRQIVDLEMWFHLLEQGCFAYLDRPLSAFRIHPDQQTLKNAFHFATIEDNFHIWDDYMSKPYINIGSFKKRYIQYDNIYKIWKMHLKGIIPRDRAVREIDVRYGFSHFIAYYPLYKIYKPLLKLYDKFRYK